MRLSPLQIAADNLEPLTFDADTLDIVSQKLEQITLPEALLKEKCGPRHIARAISDVLHSGASENVRLRAAELASKLGGHDVGREASSINIVINDSNVNLNSLFCPQR